jgi:hypothetical protein
VDKIKTPIKPRRTANNARRNWQNLNKSKSTHGGKREGAGRKSAALPVFIKKLRATEQEWREFMSYLTGNAEQDFKLILEALRKL